MLGIVVDNGMYGTIRMHQEREHPGRVVGTDLVNLIFEPRPCARRPGETVTQTSELRRRWVVLDAGRPALLHLRIDPQAITMSATIDEIRSRARR
jgi:acetolactate synthase-1/2/3 large subunit